MGLSEAGPSSPGKSTTLSSPSSSGASSGSGSSGFGGGGGALGGGAGLGPASRFPAGKSTTLPPPAGGGGEPPLGRRPCTGKGMVSSFQRVGLGGPPPNSAISVSREKSSGPGAPVFCLSSRSSDMMLTCFAWWNRWMMGRPLCVNGG